MADWDWNPTDQQINQTKEDYIKQCSVLNQKDAQQDNLWKVLAIGRINQKPDFLSNLASLFTQDRIKTYHDSNGKQLLHLQQWISASPTVKTYTDDNKNKQQLLRSALSLYFKRVCNQISFEGIEEIKDDILPFADYFYEGFEFIQSRDFRNYIDNKSLPFQFDLWIIPKEVMVKEDSDSEAEEEKVDEDDVENEDYDIEARLIYNKLPYVKHKRDSKDQKIFKNVLFDRFLQEHKAVNKTADFPKNKRVIAIVDRRKKVMDGDDEKKVDKEEDMKDDIYMFYPDKANVIPSDYLSEVFIQNSCEYILGGMDNNSDKLVTAQSGSGNMFLLSFHVLQEDEVKVYLYQRGQIARFYPENIINLWPYLFEKNEANETFINQQSDTGKKGNFARKLQVKDDKFDAFRGISMENENGGS